MSEKGVPFAERQTPFIKQKRFKKQTNITIAPHHLQKIQDEMKTNPLFYERTLSSAISLIVTLFFEDKT